MITPARRWLGWHPSSSRSPLLPEEEEEEEDMQIQNDK
jgi:hypothetical protein